MPRLQYKTFATPDEVPTFPNGRAEVFEGLAEERMEGSQAQTGAESAV